MSTTFGKNVLRSSAFALACFALSGVQARAAVLHTYSTSGAIMGDGITTSAGSAPTAMPISFNPVVSGTFTAPSAVSLGEFVVSTLPDGQTVNYDNTKFSLSYNPVTIAGTPYPATSAPLSSPVIVTGNQSSVQATFDPITSPTFSSADKQYLSTLSVLNNPLALVPSSAGGHTTLQAGIMTTTPAPAGSDTTNQVPEPTTFAILATAMVGLGLRHRLRTGRKPV